MRLVSILMLQRRFQHGGLEAISAEQDCVKAGDRFNQRACYQLQARRAIAEGTLTKAAEILETLDNFTDTFLTDFGTSLLNRGSVLVALGDGEAINILKECDYQLKLWARHCDQEAVNSAVEFDASAPWLKWPLNAL